MISKTCNNYELFDAQLIELLRALKSEIKDIVLFRQR
jgi:hypothetical protein